MPEIRVDGIQNQPINQAANERAERSTRFVRAINVFLFVCFIGIPCISVIAQALTPSQPSILYTLGLYIGLGAVPILMLMSLIAFATLGFGLLRRAETKALVILFETSAVMMVCGGLSLLFGGSLPPLFDTLSHQGHMYHLIYARTEEDSAKFTTYIVIECDSWGVACRHYAEPLMTASYNTDELSARLVVDTMDQQLYLQADGRRYAVRYGDVADTSR